MIGRKVVEMYPELPACVAPYDIRFPLVAARVASLVLDRIPGVTVEHIGSTAVPGCSGKGVIDILVVSGPECFEDVKGVISDLGFQPQSTRDPFPESRPMRVGALQHAGQLFAIHVHIVPSGTPEAPELVAFRDRLRADTAFRRAYESCKQAIVAAGIMDTVAYSEAKEPFFRNAQAGRGNAQGSA